MVEFNFIPNNNYNFDGICTVLNPYIVLAKKHQKQIGRIVSEDRGSNVTAGHTASIMGNCMPPFIVFKEKNVTTVAKTGFQELQSS